MGGTFSSSSHSSQWTAPFACLFCLLLCFVTGELESLITPTFPPGSLNGFQERGDGVGMDLQIFFESGCPLNVLLGASNCLGSSIHTTGLDRDQRNRRDFQPRYLIQ
ncbi:hypothetical protein QBC44DRAFT_323988 [Cladorrhinum sp. PSN332]|nr:hypothetical protein QBC44DRAFT_323988 [Cladorrhinum sp. PSN332]